MTECTPPTDSKIYTNYLSILKYIKKRYEQLQYELCSYNITDVSNQSFTDLINKISDIQAFDTFYDWNIKPLDDPGTINKEDIESYTFSEYNIFLAKQLNYYMRLLGYYLVLKGIDVKIVNQADNLETRIRLLEYIDAYQGSDLQPISDKEFRYLTTTEIPYSIIGMNSDHKPITNGYIYLKDEDGRILYRTVAGQPLYITPKTIGDEVKYQIEYEGYAQYEPITVDYIIKVLKALPEAEISSFTSYDDNERYTIQLTKSTEAEQLNMTMYLTATLIDEHGYAVQNKKVDFYVNGIKINNEDIFTNNKGEAYIDYTITQEEDLIIRAATDEQVSNYFHIQLVSYFNILKEMLSHIRYVFTWIKEDENNGALKSTCKYVDEIQTVKDLKNVIYDMYATEDEWGYVRFIPSHDDFLTKEEFNNLTNILADYHDTGSELTIRTLNDVEEEYHALNGLYEEYITKVINKLHTVEHVYTHIEEDENGTLIGTKKNTSEIQSLIDLDGIIYDMYADSNEWGYTVFNTNRTYMNNNDFNDAMSILIDYNDNGEEIIITTLGDIDE